MGPAVERETIIRRLGGTDEQSLSRFVGKPYKRRGELDKQAQLVPNAIGIIAKSKTPKGERSLRRYGGNRRKKGALTPGPVPYTLVGSGVRGTVSLLLTAVYSIVGFVLLCPH